MSVEAVEQFFKCPTSGQMIGYVVSAFRLHLKEVGGLTAEFLGSGNAGKRSRDYFEGKWIPDETRKEICQWIAKAALHSELFPRMRLPAAQSGAPTDLEDTLCEALVAWSQIWDAIYAVPANRWPKADRCLAGFVLARQVVIDIALRWAGFCHLSGIKSIDGLVLEIAKAGRKSTIMHRTLEMAGMKLTRDEFSKRIRRERPSTNDRTVDRWFDDSTIPDYSRLVAVSKVLSPSAEDATKLLRGLRVQYAMTELLGQLYDSVDARLFDLLRDALSKFMLSATHTNKRLTDLAGNDTDKMKELSIGALTLFAMGTASPVAGHWLQPFAELEPGPVWGQDIRYAAHGSVDARLIACMRVIEDFPRLQAAIAQRNKTATVPIDSGREVLELAAIMSMNDNRVPPEMARWMAEHPEQVHRIVGEDRMKAANRAEQATQLMNRKDFDGAIPHWARAAELAKLPREKSNYLFFYGGCLWQSKARRFEDAIKALTESYQLWPKEEPQRDRPFVEIAIIYQNRGWFENALEHLDTDPEDFATKSGHFNYVKARTLVNLDRLEEALVCYEKSIELNVAGLADAYAYSADCAFELNKRKPDKTLAQKGRKYAKEALHRGRSWAHERWGVGS